MKNLEKRDRAYTPQDVFPSAEKDNAKLLGISKTAKKLARLFLVAKGTATIAAGIMVLMAVAYLVSLMYSGTGGFTIQAINGNPNKKISISETAGFANPTVLLNGLSNFHMDNITYTWLPLDELGTVDGDHSGENYLAYTFYVKNSGSQPLNYTGELNYSFASFGVDAAVRVMVYVDGSPVIYALPTSDGGVEAYPENTVNFVGHGVVMTTGERPLEAAECEKYTVVIWLEGEDPQCVDAVRGGTMKLSMDLKVTDPE